MGTNYSLHLGKTSNTGRDIALIWAVPPRLLELMADACPGAIVSDEYGKEMTLWQYWNDIAIRCHPNRESIGKDFS